MLNSTDRGAKLTGAAIGWETGFVVRLRSLLACVRTAPATAADAPPRRILLMASSPPPHPHASRAPVILLLALVGVLGFAALSAHAHSAYADAQPTLTVTVKSAGGTATTTVYTAAATGFPAGAAFTETLGDGSGVAPATGTVNASGNFTIYWTLDASTKYCGTLTAKTDTISASASFWVAPTSDAQSGTPCQGSAGGGTPTPDASPSPSTSPTPATTATAAAPLPTTTPGTGSGSSRNGRLQAILAAIPWKWLGIGGGGLIALIVIMSIVSALGKRSSAESGRTSARRAAIGGGMYGARMGSSSARQRVAHWQAPPTPSAQRYVPYRGEEAHYGADMPQRAPLSTGRRRRVEDHSLRPAAPDPRWTRGQPGPRGGTSTRERAAHRNGAWEDWSGRR
jgi:hypothetical protein